MRCSQPVDRSGEIRPIDKRIAEHLAELLGEEVESSIVQDVIARHHAWIENFYPVNAERYLGLARMYVSDERFTAYYDAYAPGLAQFLSNAMRYYASTRLGS